MHILEIIGIATAVILLLCIILAIGGFLASLLYFHEKWEEHEAKDHEEIRTINDR